ncbi:MAG: hypothetical protein EA384_11440 [Spirochaetaceae bacterium]|nr:MAG: hypothetical protein EA384_11440 [Spirochaetaceae bacterium]
MLRDSCAIITRAIRAALVLAAVGLLPAVGAAASPAALRVGMMPAVNSIPLIVAEAEGFFSAEGVAVELEMFHNQLYRETALQTGRIDGSVSDLINAVNAVAGGFAVQVTSVTDGLFGLVTAPRSRIRSIDDWKSAGVRSVQVGLLQDSIIFYSAERILQAYGVDPRTIAPISTLQVPTRMEMVVAGQIEAAMLPEPMTRVAMARGAHLIADSSVMDQTPGVLLFTPQAVSEKAEQIAAFYRAYDRAVQAINAGPDHFRRLIVDAGGFPPMVRDSMVIPRFQPARVPTEDEFEDVVKWMRQKGLLDGSIGYRSVISDLIPAR